MHGRARQDVDFGFLGSAPGHRGRFNGFAAADGGWGVEGKDWVWTTSPVATTEVSTGGSKPYDPTPWLNAFVDIIKPQPKPGATNNYYGPASRGTPKWLIPVAGLAVAGGVAYFLFFRK